jgi:WD40 repeat protein
MHTLVSTSTDGKILIWNPDNKLSHPTRGHLIARKKKGQLAIVGGTALDVNSMDKNTFILGTEGGTIFKCNLSLTQFSEQFAAAGDFENLQKKLRWRKDAEEVMNTINNKVGMEQVKQEVERYCMDRGYKEVEPVHIFNAKPDIKVLYSIPFNLSYEKQYGPNQSISCSPFHRKLFLSCSIDGTVRMYDINNTRCVGSFEPSSNEYLMDVCFSPIRPAVFAVIGTRGIPYIYDLTVSKQTPAYILEEADEESKVAKNPGGVKIMFNPKQRDFLAVGYMEGKTKIYKLNFSLSNPKKNEIQVLNEFLEDVKQGE